MEYIHFLAIFFYLLPIVIYFSCKTTGYMVVSGGKISWDILIFIPVLNFFGLIVLLGELFGWWD